MRPITPLIQQLGISYPIIQAPMAGGITTPELVAAVSNAGGLGALGAGYVSPDAMRQAIRQIRALSSRPFAVNLFIPAAAQASLEAVQKACAVLERVCAELPMTFDLVQPPYVPNFAEQMAVIVQEKVPIFSFVFGLLSSDWITTLQQNGTILIGTATTLAEARALEAQGIDMVVVQGSEAGGHRGSFMDTAENSLLPLNRLLPELVAHLRIPIIAAGGIMNGRGIAAALKLGAAGVQMGSAFLCCEESGAHASYKQALWDSRDDRTVLTRAFSGKLARGIRNKFITDMATQQDAILEYPIQHALTSPLRKTAQALNCTDFMSMWAGQSAHLSRRVNASTLMAQLVEECEFGSD